MKNKLWFVTDGIRTVGVFNDQKEAESEMQKYQDDPDYDYYDHYGVLVDDLDDYPDEYEIAMKHGFIE